MIRTKKCYINYNKFLNTQFLSYMILPTLKSTRLFHFKNHTSLFPPFSQVKMDVTNSSVVDPYASTTPEGIF